MPKALRKPKRTTSGISNLVRRRNVSVYDAVAGRVTTNGFIPDAPIVSKERDTISSTHVPLPPDQVLFKKARAPTRYEEHDIYNAYRFLGEGDELPDGDLLRALHAYCSDFYAARFGAKGARRDWRSLDETALLAMGVLIEEQAKEMLGKTGDLVFVEPEDEDEDEDEEDQEGVEEENGVGVESATPASRPESRRAERAASAMSVGSLGSHASVYLGDQNLEFVPASGSEASNEDVGSQRSGSDGSE